jgi:hypothetical protein
MGNSPEDLRRRRGRRRRNISMHFFAVPSNSNVISRELITNPNYRRTTTVVIALISPVSKITSELARAKVIGLLEID